MTEPSDHIVRSVRASSSRREFVRNAGMLTAAGVLAPSFLAACGSSGDDGGEDGAGGSITTQFSWVKNVEWAGFWVGDDQGYYAEEGITNNFIGGGPNVPENVQVIEAGTAGIGLASDTLKIIDAAGEGADFVMFEQCCRSRRSASPGSIPRSRRSRTSSASASAATGLVAIDGSTLCSTLNGHSPRTTSSFSIGYDPAPLANGEVDAILCYVTNQASCARGAGA